MSIYRLLTRLVRVFRAPDESARAVQLASQQLANKPQDFVDALAGANLVFD
jgi:hypothetical protein